MTEHPAIAAGCTPEEIRTFECLTMNDQIGHTKAVIQSLLAKRLIAVAPDIITTEEGYTAKVYSLYVPIAIHHQFCSWAAEQPGGEPL